MPAILILRGNEQFGPYSEQEVRQYFDQGSLLPTDMVWHVGMADWIVLSEFAKSKKWKVSLPAATIKIKPFPLDNTANSPRKPSWALYGAAGLALATSTGLLILSYSVRSDNSYSNERIKSLESEVARLRAAVPPATNPTVATPPAQSPEINTNGALTREIAARLLNQHLSTPHISQLAFVKGGLQRAQQDGLVAEAGGFPPTYRFTDKGIEMVGGLVNADTRIALAPFGLEDPKFPLTAPIAEAVTVVTGIALAPVPNICEVEYTTQYLIPKEGSTMTLYIYSGQRTKATFQKYDDGWRVTADN